MKVMQKQTKIIFFFDKTVFFLVSKKQRCINQLKAMRLHGTHKLNFTGFVKFRVKYNTKYRIIAGNIAEN